MRYAMLHIWREPSNHHSDCYLCLMDPSKRRKGKTPLLLNTNIPSSIAPVPHNTSNLPVPNPPQKAQQMVAVESSEDSEMEVGEPSLSFGVRRCQRSGDERCPYYPNQEDINDLIGEMALTKSNAELLVSRLKQWELLDKGVRFTSQGKRQCNFSRFFSLQDELCYCHDVKGLFQAIGNPCNTNDWRLFIDSSSRSLKAVLLHNTNKCPSIPLAHSVVMKENYQNEKALPDALNYAQYKWNVIGDFKMVAFLMGLQGGFTKFPCFLLSLGQSKYISPL